MTTVASLLEGAWEVGAPSGVGALAVFPLLGCGPAVDVVTLGQALCEGTQACELPDRASVNDIVVSNPTRHVVLLLDGEEVVGAQQNRVFDGSVLVPAHSELRVPVCCVEQGRWDGRAHGARFGSSSQVAHPELRAAMARRRDPGTGRTDQLEVWSQVSQRIARTGTETATRSMADVYSGCRVSLDAVVERVPLRPGQRGMIVFIGGRFAALDWVASEEAWADLHPRLVRGCALDAIDRFPAAEAVSRREVLELVSEVLAVPLHRVPTLGAGHQFRGDCRARGMALHASAAELDGRLAQLGVLAA